MAVQTRLDAEYAALLGHPIVQSTELVRRTVNRLDGYLRVRIRLVNDCHVQQEDNVEPAMPMDIKSLLDLIAHLYSALNENRSFGRGENSGSHSEQSIMS